VSEGRACVISALPSDEERNWPMRIRWDDSGSVDPGEAVKPSSARGTVPYSAALDPAVQSTALRSQDGPMRVAAAAGSGNFTFKVPVAHYPGRGRLPLALDLVYNSRVWQRSGTANPRMVFDIDDDWPAPGWSLHFGRLVAVGGTGMMFVEPDGTRRPFKVDRVYPVGARGQMVEAHTIDGTGIVYNVYWSDGRPSAGRLTRADGTHIVLGCKSAVGDLFTTRITDVNGNMMTITYLENVGPRIDTVTDTCGRIIRFGYSEDDMTGRNVLFNVSGPSPGRPLDETPVRERELVRFSIGGTALGYSFVDEVADAPLAKADALHAIFMPATGTGFWFPPESYSAYGMLKRVTACRGMSIPGAGQPNAGEIQPGPISWERVYNYPDAGTVLSDSPTYTTLTETWAGQDTGPAVTHFNVSTAGDVTRAEVTWPDGSKTVRETKTGAVAKPPGLLQRLDVFDADGRRLQHILAYWQLAADGTPQIVETHTTDAVASLVKTTFGYGPEATEPTTVDQWQFAHANYVLRRTQTDYVRDPKYLNRNLRNLPQTVRVFDPYPAHPPYNLTTAACTEYEYDQTALAAIPGKVGFDETFDPGNTEEYEAKTIWRGNPTTIRRYADAATHAGAITERRTYDRCGNLLTSDVGPGRTQQLYRPEAKYMAPSATRLAASDPAVGTFLEVSATTYNSVGQPRWLTDANGQRTEVQYDEAGRPTRLISARPWLEIDAVYDDTAMTHTKTTWGNGKVISEQKTFFDGHGRVSMTHTLGGSGPDVVLYDYDLRGRLHRVSAPTLEGQHPVWATMQYDALNRPVRATDFRNGMTEWHYDEGARPANASRPSSLPGSTARITDPAGRERWQLFDALGRIQQVVAPVPEGPGTVLPTGGVRTDYSYDTLDNIIGVDLTVPGGAAAKQRRFRYDSLSRLRRVFLPECGAGIREVTAGGEQLWSFLLEYDERSNLVTRKDSRGVITRYAFAGDPLDRLQRITYDTSEFTDAANPIAACPDVAYTYVETGDIRRVKSETAVGVSSQTFEYDPFDGMTGTTLTLAGVENFPFTVGYPHDVLGRNTGVLYPALYGEGAPAPRPAAQVVYGLSGVATLLHVDHYTVASDFVYGPAGLIKSMIVGGPNRATTAKENYTYDASLTLVGQQVIYTDDTDNVRLDLAYAYGPATFAADGQAKQLSTVTDLREASGSRAYFYDALGRLTTAAGGQAQDWTWVENYGYDLDGNRTSVQVRGETFPGWAAPRDGVAALAFDAANRITTDGFRYDAAGNLVASRTPEGAYGTEFRYQYDAAGRLVLVRQEATGKITMYVYGASNRRHATLHLTSPADPNEPWPPANRTSLTLNRGNIKSADFFVWDGNHVIAHYQDSGPQTGKALVWTNAMFFLGARLLCRHENLGATTEVLYEHPGLSGTRYVTGIGVSADHEQLPFGSRTVTGGGGAHIFTTYDRDRDNGLDYAVNRFYHPELGRFLQPDPIGPAAFHALDPQSLNLYNYCGNDPINRTDPLGLRWMLFWVDGGFGGGGGGYSVGGTWYPAYTLTSGHYERVWIDESPRDSGYDTRGGPPGRGGGGGGGGGGGQRRSEPAKPKEDAPSPLVAMLTALDWKVDALDTLTGLGAAIAAGGTFGQMPVALLFTDTIFTAGVAGGGLAGAGMFGVGVGITLDAYMTSVIGKSVGEYAGDIWEKLARPDLQ